MNDSYSQKVLNTAILELGAEKTRHISTLQQNEPVPDVRSGQLANDLAEARRALAEAHAVVADWQSAMEAWKDLAITLREEIKACPNHEAHKFGKADKAVLVDHMNKKEDEERVKRNLKPKYKK